MNLKGLHALLVLALSLTVSLAQTNFPSGISVRFSEREYDSIPYFGKVKGATAFSNLVFPSNSTSESFLRNNIGQLRPISGRFWTWGFVRSELYGLYTGAGFSAFIHKGTLSQDLSGEEVSFDFSVNASKQVYETSEYFVGDAIISCELEISSDGPFLWETYYSHTNSVTGEGEDNVYGVEVLPAGTYYVDFHAETTSSSVDGVSDEMLRVLSQTNSTSVRYNLTKLRIDPPKVASFRRQEGTFVLEWNDVWDRAVRIQRNSSLTSTNWETIGYGAIGQKSFVDTSAPIGSAFYRLVW